MPSVIFLLQSGLHLLVPKWGLFPMLKRMLCPVSWLPCFHSTRAPSISASPSRSSSSTSTGSASKTPTVSGTSTSTASETARTPKVSRTPSSSTLRTATSTLSVTPSVSPSTRSSNSYGDLRACIMKGMEPCFYYAAEQKEFHINCSVLSWHALGYAADTYITLRANETFDGSVVTEELHNYRRGSGIIDLDSVENFHGLFAINDTEELSFTDAPLIKNVHVRNGEVAEKGGFIVKREQKFFIIDSCSSTGEVAKKDGGGICGYKSGCTGQIKLSNSYSTGKITGTYAGGITGANVGCKGGIVNITQCHSTGNMEGGAVGGICGDNAALENGTVYIKQCYSTGDVVADNSGGIMSSNTGNNGYVHIQACYSTGQISATEGGGITGDKSATEKGEVHIKDCYTRGNISGDNAGGITGSFTGGSARGLFGDVYINNTYASGFVKCEDAGGIIGHIDSDFQGSSTIHVPYSVYNNGNGGGRIVGSAPGSYLGETGNSDDLDDIRGHLYYYDGIQRWDNERWVINGTDSFPILRFQVPPSSTLTTSTSPTPTASESATPSASATASVSPTPTVSRTPSTSSSRTATSTLSVTPSISPSPSCSSSPTGTTSETPTASESTTPTASETASMSTTSSMPSTSSPSPSKASVSPGLSSEVLPRVAQVALVASFGSIAILMSLFILFRRRRNRHLKSGVDDPKQVYAAQLGIPLTSLAVMTPDTGRNNTFQMRALNDTVNGSGATLSDRTNLIESRVEHRDPSGELQMGQLNSCPSGGNPMQQAQYSNNSSAGRGTMKANFSLNEGNAYRWDIRAFGDSQSLAVGDDSTSYNVFMDNVAEDNTESGTTSSVDSQETFHGSQVKLLSQSNDVELAHINPLATNGSPQQAHYDADGQVGDSERISDTFALARRNAQQRDICHSSQVSLGNETVQSSTQSHAVASESASHTSPQIAFVQPGSQRKNDDDVYCSQSVSTDKVPVVSGSAPKLREVDKRKSDEGKPTLKVALITDIDTSKMKRVDRAKLKLRQWKARVLDEPPPLVEVEVGSYSNIKGTSDGSAGSSQLEFAKNDVKGTRHTLSREAKSHRSINLELRSISKKEFGQSLPSRTFHRSLGTSIAYQKSNKRSRRRG